MSASKEGGDLFDMASQPKKIEVAGDAGVMNIIPSKPRPDQVASKFDPNYLGSENIDQAATNAGDIPRSTLDQSTSQILTGTGDSLPSTVDSKRLHSAPGGSAGDPLSKGHPRYEKHHAQKGSDLDFGAGEGAGVQRDVPGLEEETEESAAEKVERKEV